MGKKVRKQTREMYPPTREMCPPTRWVGNYLINRGKKMFPIVEIHTLLEERMLIKVKNKMLPPIEEIVTRIGRAIRNIYIYIYR